MFVAIQPLTESSRVGPPIKHVPGDVLERWADWPYRVRVALLHAEMVEERPDVLPVAPAGPNAAFAPVEDEDSVLAEPMPSELSLPEFACPSCDRNDFASASALKRHMTRKHT